MAASACKKSISRQLTEIQGVFGVLDEEATPQQQIILRAVARERHKVLVEVGLVVVVAPGALSGAARALGDPRAADWIGDIVNELGGPVFEPHGPAGAGGYGQPGASQRLMVANAALAGVFGPGRHPSGGAAARAPGPARPGRRPGRQCGADQRRGARPPGHVTRIT